MFRKLPRIGVATSNYMRNILLLISSIYFHYSKQWPQVLTKIQKEGRRSDSIQNYSSLLPESHATPWPRITKEADSSSTQFCSAFLQMGRASFWPFIHVSYSDLPLYWSYYVAESWRVWSDKESKACWVIGFPERIECSVLEFPLLRIMEGTS